MSQSKRLLNFGVLNQLAALAADTVSEHPGHVNIYAVPRGGVPALYLMLPHLDRRMISYSVVTRVEDAQVIVDDLIDSGSTRRRIEAYLDREVMFVPLIHKGVTPGYPIGEWLVFPWEHSNEEDTSAHDIFTRLIQFVGEDPSRGGLKDTPSRMQKAWTEWTAGYKQDPQDVLKLFEDGGEKCNEMVIEHDIPFYSQCEHHLAPFFGTITFAYLPDKKVVGLSKMHRLIDVFARRLQVQERLTVQIVDAFMEHVKPLGAACLVRARHLCMESRGIRQQGISTTTSALRGRLADGAPRSEFLTLATAPR
jgi:GTP cyclohydrolase I